MNLPLSKRIHSLPNLHLSLEIVLKFDSVGHNVSMETQDLSSKRSGTKFKRIVGPALITLGVVLVIFALIISTQGSEDIRIEGNPAIEALIPEEDSEVLRQAAVGIDLASGYDAELTINDIPIPRDQINVLRSEEDPRESAGTGGSFGSTLNRFVFQPLAHLSFAFLQFLCHFSFSCVEPCLCKNSDWKTHDTRVVDGMSHGCFLFDSDTPRVRIHHAI